MRLTRADFWNPQQALNLASSIFIVGVVELKPPFYEVCLFAMVALLALRLLFTGLHLMPWSGFGWSELKVRLLVVFWSLVKFSGITLAGAFLFYSATVIVGQPWDFHIDSGFVRLFAILPIFLAFREFLFPNPMQLEFQWIFRPRSRKV